jgi:tetraacyldisaccharide 4'-kinase
MPFLDAIANKVRLGQPLPLPWDLLLRAATPVTRIGMAHRLRQNVSAVDAHVVAFGNITAGGTGKTPAVIERAREEVSLGHQVAVVTRGYGSARVSEPFIVEASMSQADVARLVGDEPALIRRHVPDCLIVKAARRLDGARVAVEQHGCKLVILDDAFQHVQLARDENVCVIDASNPFGNGHLVPRGILREPLTSLSRATAIILTRCDQAVDLQSLRAIIDEAVPGVDIRETVHAPGRLWNVRSGEVSSLQHIQESAVTAVSAIGNPEAFHTTLEQLGIVLVEKFSYRDHDDVPIAELPQTGVIVTTEKDAMRIQNPPDNLYALEVVLKDWVEV